MNPAQFYISVAITPVTTIVIVLIGVLLNNNNTNRRLDDFGKRLDDLRDLLRAEIRASHSELRVELHNVQAEILAALGKIENRIERLEAQRLVR